MRRTNEVLKLTRAEIAAAFGDPNWAAAHPPVLGAEELSALLKVLKSAICSWSSRGLLRGGGRRVGEHLRFIRDRVLIRIFNEGLNDHHTA